MTYADGATLTYTWDAGNALTQITDSQAGTITRTYDLLDRLTEETMPQGSISYTYDAAGRRTSMTVAGQPAVTYTYDDADRLASVTQGSNVVTVTYDAAGRRTSLTLPNGVVTEATYDAASRVTGLTYRQGTTTLGTLSYTYDAVGNRVGVGGTWARTALPPALDAASYDAANRHLTFDGQVLAYDLNGDLLSDGTSGYTWDARNRLTGITGPITATFQYDATGRRTRKTIDGVTTDFLHDGITPVTESSGGGTGFLLTGLGVDDVLLRLGPGSTAMFLTDALGSLVATTDGAGGVQSELTYEPFGATELSAPAPAYRFTAREHDEPLDLYYYRARYYHTDLQRFISEDPIGMRGSGPNLYAYVENSPINFNDPLGLQAMPAPGSTDAVALAYLRDFGRGSYLMYANWRALGQFHRILGADKYFHCKANCQAAQRGPGGEAAAALISEAKEYYDQWIRGMPAADSVADMAANLYGRACGANNPNGPCNQFCARYRPVGLPATH